MKMTEDQQMNAVRLSVIWFVIILTIDAFYVGMIYMTGPVGLSVTDEYVSNLLTGNTAFAKNLQIANNSVNNEDTKNMYGESSNENTFLDKVDQTLNTLKSVTIIFAIIGLGPLFFSHFLWTYIENPVLTLVITVFLIFCNVMFWIQVLKLIFRKGDITA